LILPLPFGVISGDHYTGLNINTAVLGGGNLEFAREIQEIVFCMEGHVFIDCGLIGLGFASIIAKLLAPVTEL